MTRWTRLRDPGQGHGRHHQGQRPDGDVDVEDPPPAQIVDEHPADQRTDDRGHPEHGHEEAHVTAALPRGDHVAHDGLGPDHQAASAEALHGPEGDQLDHGVAESGERRPDEEQHDGHLKEELPAVHVAQLPPQGGRHRRGQEVGGDHPAEVGGAVQVADDGGQCRRHHRLVQGGQEHAEHQRPDDDQDPTVGQGGDALGHNCRSRVAHRLALHFAPTAGPVLGRV